MTQHKENKAQQDNMRIVWYILNKVKILVDNINEQIRLVE